MKILNLYAGIGGNRKLWGPEHEVTAVEISAEIAVVYHDYNKEDQMLVVDAHQYLLGHYNEFDFIWASPPCPTHSRARFWARGKTDPVYADMKLYQEILFLKNHFKGKWVVENVVPYYEPLITDYKKIGRHLFWSNFVIGDFELQEADIKDGNIGEWEKLHGISLKGYSFTQRKDKIMRNCVHPETGLYILDCAMGIIRKENEKQMELFEL